MTEEPKPKPTKKFLLDEIDYFKKQIAQNEGALNLCVNMLKAGCYIEEEKPDGGN